MQKVGGQKQAEVCTGKSCCKILPDLSSSQAVLLSDCRGVKGIERQWWLDMDALVG